MLDVIESNIPDIGDKPEPDYRKLMLADRIIETLTPILDETQYQLKCDIKTLEKKLFLIENNIYELKNEVDEKIENYEREKSIRHALMLIDKAILNGSIYSGTLSSEVIDFLVNINQTTKKFIDEVLIPKLNKAIRQ